MLEALLTRLDLEPGEITTYLSLLEAGPTPAGTLAKHTGTVRVTQYLFLRRLIDKGLVTQSIKNGIKNFTAEPPEKIGTLYQEKITALTQDHARFQKLLPELKAKRPDRLLTPKFQIFEGVEGLKNVLKDMLLYRDMQTHAYWPAKKMVELLSPAFFEHHNKERIKRNLFTRAIWPKDQVAHAKEYPYLGTGSAFRREIRVAPTDIKFSMGYWIYGHKAVLLSSRKESYGCIIESSELTEMLLSQFDVIWKLSKPIKEEPTYTKEFLDTLSSN